MNKVRKPFNARNVPLITKKKDFDIFFINLPIVKICGKNLSAIAPTTDKTPPIKNPSNPPPPFLGLGFVLSESSSS